MEFVQEFPSHPRGRVRAPLLEGQGRGEDRSLSETTPQLRCVSCAVSFSSLCPGPRHRAGGAFKYRTSQRAGADGGARGGKDSPTLGARPSPLGFHDQGHCTGRKEEEEEVQGSFWYQGRKTLWEEVVCRGEASAQQEKMSSTVTGSLPPEGHHGGHLGGRGEGLGVLEGKGSREPPALSSAAS